MCTKCDGYGVQQCHVCEGQGKLIWEGKLRRMDPCPLCFGSCLEKVRFFFFCESSCVYCQRQIAMQVSVCGISQEWVITVLCSSAALLFNHTNQRVPSCWSQKGKRVVVSNKPLLLMCVCGLQCRRCGGIKMKRGIPPNLQTQTSQNVKKSWDWTDFNAWNNTFNLQGKFFFASACDGIRANQQCKIN